MSRAQKALYGNIAMIRRYCNACKQYALVLDGVIQCCDRRVDIPDELELKRMSEPFGERRPLPKKLRMAILASQDNKCLYCECDLTRPLWDNHRKKHIEHRIHYDHQVPWSFDQNNEKRNMVASCALCNLVKGSRFFRTLDEAKVYILGRRKAREGESD